MTGEPSIDHEDRDSLPLNRQRAMWLNHPLVAHEVQERKEAAVALTQKKKAPKKSKEERAKVVSFLFFSSLSKLHTSIVFRRGQTSSG